MYPQTHPFIRTFIYKGAQISTFGNPKEIGTHCPNISMLSLFNNLISDFNEVLRTLDMRAKIGVGVVRFIGA